MDYVTYYKGEDLHPQIAGVFDWYKTSVLDHIKVEKEVAILAGGALRSYFTQTPVNDYDLYFPDDKSLEKVKAQLDYGWKGTSTKKSTTRTRAYLSHSGVNLTALNLISGSYKTPAEVLDTFDFTVCMCAVTHDQIVLHPDYFIDLQTKQLRINNVESPLNTLWRLQKYNQYGFTASREELWRIATEINQTTLPRVYKGDKESDAQEVKLTSIFTSS